MGIDQHMIIWFGAVIGLGGLWLLMGKRILSPDARERRRRSRNYGTVISRRSGRAVKLAVKTGC